MHARSQVPGKGETGSCGGLCVCREVGFVAWEGGDWLRIAESVAALAWLGVREVSGNGLRGESALAERRAYPVG